MLIRNQQKINEYDYKNMMRNFASESRHIKYLNNIKNKWIEISCKYKEKIELIKINNEKINRIRNKAFKKRYLQKENSIKHQLELKKQEKLEVKKQLTELFKKKNEDATKKLEKFHKKQEEERIKLEVDTFQKSI